VLINNAGPFGSRKLTPDNLEDFRDQSMAYFVLTLDCVTVCCRLAARVVSTASNAHKGYTLDFDDLQAAKVLLRDWCVRQIEALQYLFTRELAGAGSTKRHANCLHPGSLPRARRRQRRLLSRVVRVAKTLPSHLKRRRNHRLSGFLARRGSAQRRVFLPVRPRHRRRCPRTRAAKRLGRSPRNCGH